MSEERFEATTAQRWRAWLDQHHTSSTGVWLVSWKKHTGRSSLTYDDSVEEALAFGWIDSKGRKLDDERTMLWFAPRRRGSAWSRPNKERIERIEADGRMADAGREAVAQAQADGSWTRLDDVEDLVVPDDLATAFASHRGAEEQWEAFPRSAKRGILEWIVQAKRAETRAKRVEETARLAAKGERANQWRRR